MSEASIVVENLFGREAVKRLTESDFLLNTTSPTDIKWTDCIIVLFYVDNQESKNLIQIFATAAEQIIGIVMAAINLKTNDKVAKAFVKILEQPGNDRAFGLKGYPFIIVYQKGKKVAFYNGGRDVQALIDWSLTLACKPDYYEPYQVGLSASVDKSYEMGGIAVQDPRTISTQFQPANPVRLYDPNIGIFETGSQAASAAASNQAQEFASAGIATPPTETGITGFGQAPESQPSQGETLGGGVAAPTFQTAGNTQLPPGTVPATPGAATFAT